MRKRASKRFGWGGALATFVIWTLLVGTFGALSLSAEVRAHEHELGDRAAVELRRHAALLEWLVDKPGILLHPAGSPEGAACSILAPPPEVLAPAELRLLPLPSPAPLGLKPQVRLRGGRRVVELQRPLTAQEACLSCHDAAPGQPLGMAAFTLPIQAVGPEVHRHILANLVLYLALWAVGLVLMVAARSYRRQFQRREAHMEWALGRSQERYQLIVESAGVIPWEVDVASGRFTYVGPQAEGISGYPPEAWRDMEAWAAMIHPDDREDAIQSCQSATASLQDHELTYRIITPNGEIRWIRDIVTVEVQEARPATLRGVIIDVSGEKAAERERARMAEQLLRSQRLESLGVLAGGIAHDFNNVLSPILGYTEMARAGLPEGHEARRALDHVVVAADRARTLVRQILAFGRQGEAERRPIRLWEMIEESASLLRAGLPPSIRLSTRLFGTEPAVLGDASQLYQVVLNLGTNAAQALGRTGGTIEMTLEEVDLPPAAASSVPPGRYARLTVRDDGPGMPPEILDRIFDPFFTTKPPGEGTGLGLSVVHGIVAGHSGWVEVQSKPGQGTRFEVFLPSCESGIAAHPAPEPVAAAGGDERLLIVDDEEVIADMVAMLLRKRGYHVIAHSDPRKALELILADPGSIDLLVTDQTMPHLTGTDLIARLHEVRPDLPVIICTGMGHRPTEWPAGAEPAEILPKPCPNQVLAAAVRRVLDQQSKGYESAAHG